MYFRIIEDIEQTDNYTELITEEEVNIAIKNTKLGKGFLVPMECSPRVLNDVVNNSGT